MRADRLLSLMFMLGAGERLTAQELATRLEVSERTVYRDVDALSAVGIPVYAQSGVNGGIFLDENYRISLGGFSRADIQSLFVATDSGPLSDLGLAKEDSLLKLFAALPAIQRREVERVRQRFFIDPTNWFQLVEESSDFSILQQAVWEDRVIQVTYQPIEGAAGERELEAYALVAKANIWYLVGRKPGSDLRNFRVSRFESVTLTDTTFERDAALDLPTYWKESCEQFERVSKANSRPYVAILRVHPRMFWYFPGWMNGRYEKLGAPDEEGWITVRAVYDSIEQARTQVLGFGTYAEALDPPELGASVIETAEAILKWHAERSLGKKIVET